MVTVETEYGKFEGETLQEASRLAQRGKKEYERAERERERCRDIARIEANTNLLKLYNHYLDGGMSLWANLRREAVETRGTKDGKRVVLFHSISGSGCLPLPTIGKYEVLTPDGYTTPIVVSTASDGETTVMGVGIHEGVVAFSGFFIDSRSEMGVKLPL